VPIPEEGWHRIHSPSSRLGFVLAGVIGLFIPFVMCAWLSAAEVFLARFRVGKLASSASMPWAPQVLALLLFIPLHEAVHAIWHPRLGLSSRTVVVIWPSKLRFGVYYGGCMTRRRWLVMRLAPFFFLTLVPIGLLTLFKVWPASFALDIFLQVLFLVNGIGSGGDIVAAVWVLRQVPAGAQVCFHGGKAYWRAAW
jgi:hypothetical protein